MPSVIFAQTRHVYDSYVDLCSLIELSGYGLVYVDEIEADNPDNCYIISPFNGEWEQGWPNAKAKIIHLDLEWRFDGEYPNIPGVAETWASDAWYANKIGARYVPMGSHPGLNLAPDEVCAERYDLAMLAYLGPMRRQDVANELCANGLRLAPNGWKRERHEILKSTRAMLHVHQHDHAFTVAPQRFALAAAYHMPLFTEHINDTGIFGSELLMADKAHLLALVRSWLNGGWAERSRLQDLGESLYGRLCVDNTFKKCIDAAV